MNGTVVTQSRVAGWMLLPLAALAWPGPVPAAEYPSQPLRLVVSYPPGGSGDFQARILGPKPIEQMGQQVVIDNLAGEMLKSSAGIDLVHVPYKGAGPQLVDVMSGNVTVGFVSLTAALPHVRAGRLKVLMVSSKQRSGAAPDIPTASESGMPEIEITNSWFGILAPARTPKAVVSRLNTEIVRAIQSPDVQARFVAQGLEPVSSTAEEFLALIKSDLVRWSRVVKESGLRVE